jgi:EAL domain-containing protein (putative c-di-GMP-specific phosphodiesterase class I)
VETEAGITTEAAELDRVLDHGGLRAVFQPIVDLQTLELVAAEALARGPEGSPLESPAALFGLAARLGRTAELDHACRSAAVEAAADPARENPLTLFLNVEPIAVGRRPILDEAHQRMVNDGGLRLVTEITERAVTQRPAEMLAAVALLRHRGVGIALDDVGADQRSLALMPFFEPDVVKLDMSLVQEQPSRAIAAIANAVDAEAERTGALILAEGIEHAEHLRRAIAMGARFGQGYMFGRPGALPSGELVRPSGLGAGTRPAKEPPGETPFEIVAGHRDTFIGDKRILLERSLQLEEQAGGLGGEGVLLSTFQDRKFFTPRTARRYGGLAESLAFVGAFGIDMPAQPVGAVRGASIEAAERLHGEWDVIVLGPHFGGAFVARDLRDNREDMDRRFQFCMTYDRELVVRAANALMGRVVPR